MFCTCRTVYSIILCWSIFRLNNRISNSCVIHPDQTCEQHNWNAFDFDKQTEPSYIGASIATVLSEVLLYFVFIYFINKHYKELGLYKQFIKPLVASLVMGGFVFYFNDVNLFLIVISAGFVYFMILLLLRTFTQEDNNILKQVVKRG